MPSTPIPFSRPAAAEPSDSRVRRFENDVVAGARRCGLRGEAVLCAVSGGADSSALLTALARRAAAIGLARLGVAHVDHGLRPSSAQDALIVANLSKELELEHFSARVQVDATQGGIEAGARAARYLALETMALQGGYGSIVTGHTRTDQAETVLLRLLRGSGLRGLSAMAWVRPLGDVRLCRPLLGLSGASTRAYAAKLKLKLAVDRSNLDPAFTRNALRLRVWPALSALQSSLEVRLAEVAAQSREDEAALESLAQAAASTLLVTVLGGVQLQAQALGSLPPAIGRRVLRLAIHQLRPAAQPTSLHLRRLWEVCRAGRPAELHLAGDLVGRLREGQLRLSARER